MADRKSNGNVAGIITAVAGMVAAVTPIINDVVDKRKDKVGETEWIMVPALYDKGFPLKLEQAIDLLTNYGLRAIPSALTLHEAHSRYKDCFEDQVISSKPKCNQKVRPGETVLVRYITREVVEESQRIFSEAEKRKATLKSERAAKRSEQMEKAKGVAVGVADKAKTGVRKIAHRKPKKDLGKESSHE